MIITLTIGTVVVVAFFAVILNTPFYMENMPAWIEQAEVIEKRMAEGDVDSYNYYITFKFYDGTEWEFAAGRPKNPEYYNAIHIGEKGKLIYRGSRNNGRFESFEKDVDYGGKIIEPYRRGDWLERVQIISLLVAFLLCSLPLIFIFIAASKQIAPVENRLEQTAQVKVIGKRRAVFAFEFLDGSVKELHDPDITIQINDTGILTYKERENIEKNIKKEKAHWRGRQFIRLEKDE